MTLQEATNQWQAGSMTMVVEYRSSVAENITWRDKTTGRTETMGKITHNCEMGTLSLPVSERVPSGAAVDVPNYKAPFKKGQQCLLTFESILRDKGNWKVNGRLEPIVTNGAK